LIPFSWALEIRPMKGELRVMKEALFYGFSLERHFPDNHLLRKIDPRPAIGGHCQALLCMDYVLAASEAFLARARKASSPASRICVCRASSAIASRDRPSSTSAD
jgi:hypothetical protein